MSYGLSPRVDLAHIDAGYKSIPTATTLIRIFRLPTETARKLRVHSLWMYEGSLLSIMTDAVCHELGILPRVMLM